MGLFGKKEKIEITDHFHNSYFWKNLEGQRHSEFGVFLYFFSNIILSGDVQKKIIL